MLARLLSLFLVAGTLAFGTAATAQTANPSPKAAAESHYQTAVRLFGEGRYREALDEFDAAIELSPESIFYCNRAIVLIQLSEPLEALRSFETCQRTFSGGDLELAEIDAQRAAVHVTVHHVRPGATDTVSAMNAPEVPEPSRSWTRATTGYVLLGTGGALLASAAVLDRLSVDLKEDLVATANGRSPDDYAAAREAYVGRQRLWLGLAAAGAAVTLTGGVVLVSWLARPDATVELGLRPGNRGVFIRADW